MVRWLKRGALALLVLIVLVIGTGWWLLRGSLATLDGTVAMTGLSAPVTIERDALGVVTIHAANELDAMRALGYVHAQERFFEMDLLRRSAAGELSELFGRIALGVDKQHRMHRFRARAVENLDTIAGDRLPLLKAYAEGVNAGLADLRVRPWPYLLLQTKPEPWQLSDTALAGYAMFFDLQGGTNERELALWRIKKVVPPALYNLIAIDGTQWDAPLEGAPRGNAALPDAATLDLRKLPAPGIDGSPPYVDPHAPGSNNFAVAGPLTKDGRAIVANDMHLGLRAPDIWFRARLLYADPNAADGKVDVSGFTLPGVPGVVVGSNTHVAWGFTNSYGDWMDWVGDCEDTPDNACDRSARPNRIFDEKILMKGESPVLMEVAEGPEGTRRPDVTGADAKLSMRWTAHRPGALTLESLDMARAPDIATGVRIMSHAGIPAQNMLIADRGGHIAWTIAGRIPAVFSNANCNRGWPAIFVAQAMPRDRDPAHPQAASSMQDPSPQVRGQCVATTIDHEPGWMDANPAILNPSSNRLWSANDRVTDGADLATIGDSGYDNGARASQIRDDLFAKDQFSEKDLLAIQLDDRALFLARWHKLLQDTAIRVHDPGLTALAAAASNWDGRADPSSVSYRIVRGWRLAVLSRIRDGLLAPAQAALREDFTLPDLPQLEGVVWPMVTQLPANLLPRKFQSWDALLVDAAHQTHSDLEKFGPLAQRRWGERNVAAICHPLAGALPAFIGKFLCMPADALPGDNNMPRVAAPDFGASERMVVSPGHEADGIIEMPGGQSGNPLSPFWGAGHEAWVHGEPTPFLPGPTTHSMRMMPGR